MEEKEARTGRGSLPPTGRVIVDSEAGVVRSWFDPRAKPVVGPFSPRELARDLLRQSARELRWDPSLPDLEDRALVTVAGSHSVRFTQRFNGVPVWASEVIVNMHADGRVHSLYNQYHYDIPAGLDPARVRMSILGARAVIVRLARAYRQRKIRRPTLRVYRFQPFEHPLPKPPHRRNRRRARFLAAVAKALGRGRAARYRPTPGQHYLVWDVTLATTRPFGRWRILVDAVAGRLLEVRDLLSYARGPHGKVFDPNPVVASGDLNLSSATPAATLNSKRVSRALERLDEPDESGFFQLSGGWVYMEEIDEPLHAGPRKKNGSFVFGSKNPDFLDVMAYYHVDRFKQYVKHDLGLNDVGDSPIPVDPQGANGGDNSFGSAEGLSFGASVDGSGVADASDAMVILHEYGHALQDIAICCSNQTNFVNGVAEGFCDFLAAVYYDDKHVKPAVTRGLMFSWNDNQIDRPSKRRRYNWPVLADSTGWGNGGGYDKGEQWASAMFELYRKLGGDSTKAKVSHAARDLVIRLHLVANSMIPGANATIADVAHQIELADTNLAGWRYANGLHLKVIYDTFRRRHVVGYDPLPVDVYIDDGRGGGYGAADSNDDNFQNTLWLDNFTDTKDIWVKRVPYAPGAASKPLDHEVPLKDGPANVYVQVKNRGAVGSGPVTVRVFRAATGGPRLWASGWTEIPAPPAQPLDVPAAGAVTAGPFTWPQVTAGKISLLAIVECATDRAVAQDLGADPGVPFADLVPFDNNIAMRDIQVTA